MARRDNRRQRDGIVTGTGAQSGTANCTQSYALPGDHVERGSPLFKGHYFVLLMMMRSRFNE